MTVSEQSLLIVEDHPVVRQGLIRALEAHGVREIFEAGNLAEGRGQLAKANPDVLITDLHLRSEEHTS